MAPRVKFTREEFAQAGLNVVRKKGFSSLTAQAQRIFVGQDGKLESIFKMG